jgi:hypothetical protein
MACICDPERQSFCPLARCCRETSSTTFMIAWISDGPMDYKSRANRHPPCRLASELTPISAQMAILRSGRNGPIRATAPTVFCILPFAEWAGQEIRAYRSLWRMLSRWRAAMTTFSHPVRLFQPRQGARGCRSRGLVVLAGRVRRSLERPTACAKMTGRSGGNGCIGSGNWLPIMSEIFLACARTRYTRHA